MRSFGGVWSLRVSPVVLSVAVLAQLISPALADGPARGAAGRAPGVVSSRFVTATDPRDYIVVLRDHACNLTALSDRWRQRYSPSDQHFHFKRGYKFGKFAAARVNISAANRKTLEKDPDVMFVEANHVIRIEQTLAPIPKPDACQRLTDGACVQQGTGAAIWGLSRTSSRALPSFPSATYTYLAEDGGNVDAYVVDTGVFAQHEEFEGRARTAFVASDIQETADDLHGHGTHVAGTIGGKTYGLAKKVNIIGVKVLSKSGIGSLGGLLEGLEWVHNDFQQKRATFGEQKAKAVVNLSLGGAPGEIQSLDEAAITLISEGGLPFVVAAGNENTDACLVSPARLSVAITVGATAKSDAMSTFSNYGPCVDILAPGEQILSSFIGSSRTTAVLSGTSMATPHVTGAIARFLSQSCMSVPTPAGIKAWLEDSSTKSVIDVKTKMATPNRLLFMFCLSDGSRSLPNTSDPAAGYGSLLYVYIGIGVIGFVCLVVLIFTCVTYRKLDGVRSPARPVRQYYQPPTTYNTFAGHPGPYSDTRPLSA